jgi:hypothetical protein
MKDFENISKIDGALNTLNLNGVKKPGMSWNSLGSAVLSKHQQLSSLGDQKQSMEQDNLNAENKRLKDTILDL